MGDPRAFELAVQAVADNRKTSLVARLQAVMTPIDTTDSLSDNEESNDEPKVFVLTEALIQSQTIDPMIGMAGVKPMDFATVDPAIPHKE
jgi:exodeoxyribonuclease V alpha subunit